MTKTPQIKAIPGMTPCGFKPGPRYAIRPLSSGRVQVWDASSGALLSVHDDTESAEYQAKLYDEADKRRARGASSERLVTRRAPAWAWAIIDETLSADCNSSAFDRELRAEIAKAAEAMIEG